jgi:hypothetical protein
LLALSLSIGIDFDAADLSLLDAFLASKSSAINRSARVGRSTLVAITVDCWQYGEEML